MGFPAEWDPSSCTHATMWFLAPKRVYSGHHNTAAIAAALLVDDDEEQKEHKKWCKDCLLRRNQCSHMKLLWESRENEPEDYQNYIRMDSETFNLLLSLVKNKIMNHMLSVKFVGAPTARSNLFNSPSVQQILWKLHTAVRFDHLVQVEQQYHKRYDYRLYS